MLLGSVAGRTLRAFVVALSALAAAGCGGPEQTTAAPVVEAPKPKPRNAALIAQAIVGGRADVLVWVDRLRNHPVGPKVAALEPWKPLLAGTGIDPERDFERAYATVPDVKHGEAAALVGEHAMPEARVRGAIDAMIAKSGPAGGWIEGSPVPAARVTVERAERVVAMVEPNVLVVLPASHAADVARFRGTGGCPDPVGGEAAVGSAVDPSHTLDGAHVPPIPKTLTSARAILTLSPDGGADLAVDAESTSEQQAIADAVAMTHEVEKATTVSLAIVKVRMFDPIAFHAEGTHVKAQRHLTAQEIDRLLAFASAMSTR